MKSARLLRKVFFVALICLALASAATQRANAQQQPPAQGPPSAQEAQQVPPAQAGVEQAAVRARPGKIVVPAGTKLPLVLHNSISTRNARPGNPVYLETLFPVAQENRIIIPAGCYVQGEILEARRPGRVKGRGEVRIRLNTMILPNGYTVNFNAIPTNAGTGGNEEVEEEGKIKGDTDKAGDVGTVVKTTATGAGIGAIAGRSAKGAGIGGGVGAAVGIAAVLLTRGPELELPRGTTLDVMLDRALYLDEDKVQFSDPGRASSLAGAPNRQPPRNRFPY